MPALDSKAWPLIAQAVMVSLVLWLASTSRANIDGAVAASHRLPLVEQRLESGLANHERRISSLEASFSRIDEKLDRIAENVAALAVEVRRK